jgi:hypothetical protein
MYCIAQRSYRNCKATDEKHASNEGNSKRRGIWSNSPSDNFYNQKYNEDK